MRNRLRTTIVSATALALLAVVLGLAPAPAEARATEKSSRLPFHGSYRVSRTWNHRGSPHSHPAIDFAMPSGREVRAAGAGTVISSSQHREAGHYVAIYHREDKRTSYYFHLSAKSVSVGRVVAAGAVIGRSGCSGNCTGPHLHYQEAAGRRPGVPAFGHRVDPGPLSGCDGRRTVTYSGWTRRAGTTVKNTGTGCR